MICIAKKPKKNTTININLKISEDFKIHFEKLCEALNKFADANRRIKGEICFQPNGRKDLWV